MQLWLEDKPSFLTSKESIKERGYLRPVAPEIYYAFHGLALSLLEKEVHFFYGVFPLRFPVGVYVPVIEHQHLEFESFDKNLLKNSRQNDLLVIWLVT